MKRYFAPLLKISSPCIKRGFPDQLPGSFPDPLIQLACRMINRFNGKPTLIDQPPVSAVP